MDITTIIEAAAALVAAVITAGIALRLIVGIRVKDREHRLIDKIDIRHLSGVPIAFSRLSIAEILRDHVSDHHLHILRFDSRQASFSQFDILHCSQGDPMQLHIALVDTLTHNHIQVQIRISTCHMRNLLKCLHRLIRHKAVLWIFLIAGISIVIIIHLNRGQASIGRILFDGKFFQSYSDGNHDNDRCRTNHDSQNRQKGTELSAKQVVDAHRQQITESHFHRSFLFFFLFR